MFIIHDETENRPAGAAAKAMIGLALRVDMKGWRFSRWNGHRARQLVPARLSGNRADDLDDIVGFGDTLDGFLREAGHKAQNTLRANLARGDSFCDAISFGLILLVSTLACACSEEQVIRKGSVVVIPLTGESLRLSFSSLGAF